MSEFVWKPSIHCVLIFHHFFFGCYKNVIVIINKCGKFSIFLACINVY
jgi:hypothetical protein